MNLKMTTFILAAVLLIGSAILLESTPAFASDNITVNVIVEQNVTVEQVADILPPPPPPPAPPAPVVLPAPPLPPAPPPPYPPMPPMYPPAPAPVYYNPYPYYNTYPYCCEYRWSTYVTPEVIVISQPLPQVQVQPAVQPQVNIDPPPVINTFTADPVYIQPGQAVNLTWTVSDVLQREMDIVITPGIGTVSSSGSYTVSPAVTTTYTLTATNVDGSVSANSTITVAPLVAASTFTTGTEASAGQGGLTGNSWLLYVLLFGLLSAAAVVVIILMTRKPRPAYAGAHTQYKAQAATGIGTGIHQTKAAAGAKFVTADGETVPFMGKSRLLGRNDFISVLKPAKADLVSRQHLHVERKDNEYYIEDTGSTNGTRLNGSSITGKGRYLLKNNDTIDLGGALSLTFNA